MTDIKFRPLFPSPMGYCNFGNANKKLNKHLIEDIENEMSETQGRNRTFKKNKNAWQSMPDLEIRYESFSILRSFIEEVSKPILRKSGVSEQAVMHSHVTKLWANVCLDVGAYARPHIHGSGRTLWSGVYYPKGLQEIENLDVWNEDNTILNGYPSNIDGMLVLFDPSRTTKALVNSSLEYEEYYGAECSIVPRESLLILFPTWITHMVTPLTKKSKRYSISFSINKGS